METVLQKFDQVVQQRPNDLCLYEQSERYTFLSTQQISDAIASRLVTVCPAPGACVAWIGGAGAKRLLAYLAIQKAGLVFFAPNTTLTDEQIGEMLAVAKPAVLLVDADFEALAQRLRDYPYQLAAFAESEGLQFKRPVVAAQVLSHLSMTSGSTGVPKILPRTRRDMGYFIDLACKLQDLGPADTTALLGNLWNPTQFTGLNVGARTACFDVPRWGAGDLADWMCAERISTVMMYPAIFRELMSANKTLPDLRCVILIGEALTRDDAEAHSQLCAPDAQLVNIYGSMEFPYLLEWRRLGRDRIDFDTMPMGRQVVADEMHLIDEVGNSVVEGEVGEIEITSHYVPTEYVDNPELTAERVRALPDGRTGLRMGDYAYRDYAGVYHTMGRRDQQTKIRGYNVRLTDVEMVIKREVCVEACAVTTAVTAQGIRKLVCYLVGDAEVAVIRSTLKQALPNYMVPSVWRKLEQLPLTPSGKVKHDLLPDPFDDSSAPKFEPLSDLEATLGELFSEILGTQHFSRDDDFFDLGGDSLQAMRLVVRCEAVCGRRPPFENLLLNGASVRELAQFFATDPTPQPSVLREGTGGATWVVAHTQDSNLSFYLPLVLSLDPKFRVVGADGWEVTGGSRLMCIADMAQHSVDILGDEVDPDKDLVLVGFSYGGAIAIEMARILYKRDGVKPRLIILDTFAVWPDKLRWLRRLIGAVQNYNLVEFWDVCKMMGSKYLPSTQQHITDTQLFAWLTYQPASLEIDQALFVCSTEPTAGDNAEACRTLFHDRLDVMQIAASHTHMMMGEQARVLAQKLQSWIDHSNATD